MIHSPSECCLRENQDIKPQRKSLKDKKALKLKVYQAALQTSSDNKDKESNGDDQDSHSTSSRESTDSNTSA